MSKKTIHNMDHSKTKRIEVRQNTSHKTIRRSVVRTSPKKQSVNPTSIKQMASMTIVSCSGERRFVVEFQK